MNLLEKIKNSDSKSMEGRQFLGMFAGIIGIILNIILFATKIIAGFLTSSIAIFADAFNNIFDATSSTVTLIGFKMAGKPADKEHPFGHGRMEYIAALVVSMIIVMVGVELLTSSVEKIITPQGTALSYVSVAILAFSIIIKLFLAVFNKSLGKKINSHTLTTASFDSICDVLATTVVLASIFVQHFLSINVDGIAGVIVALFILYTGIMSAKETLNSILGQSPSEEFVKAIEEKVLSYQEVLGVHDLIVHNYGPTNSVVSLHAEVSSDAKLVEIHHVIDIIERNFKNDMGCEVVIHIDPIGVNDEHTNEVRGKLEVLIKLIDPELCLHDFRMVYENSRTDLIFDVEVPHRLKLSDEEIKARVLSAAKTIDVDFEILINIDKT